MKTQQTVFISYCSQDKEFATKLATDLSLAGVKIWIDQGEIKLGDSLIEKIRQGIDEVDYLAVVLSPVSVNSEWVKREVEIAMTQEIENRRVKVLPLLFKKCDLPGFLKGKRYADFTKPELYDEAFTELLDRLGFNKASTMLIYGFGGGTIDVASIKIKDEYKGQVDKESMRSDLQAVGKKHQDYIEKRPPPLGRPPDETTGAVLAGRLSMSRIRLSFSGGYPRLNWEWGGWEDMPPHLIALLVAATVIENDTLPQLRRPSRAKFTFSSPSGLTQAEANISFTSDHLMFEVEKTYGGQDGFVLANPTKEVLRLLWKADVRSELAYERIAATDVGEIGNGRGATHRNYVEMRVPLL